MIFSNFELLSSVELAYEGRVYDLHNFMSLQSVQVLPRDAKVELILVPAPGYTGAAHDVASLTLAFEDVSRVEFVGGLSGAACETIEEIGFKEVEDRDMDWLKDPGEASVADHWVIRFSADNYLRLSCAGVAVYVQKLVR